MGDTEKSWRGRGGRCVEGGLEGLHGKSGLGSGGSRGLVARVGEVWVPLRDTVQGGAGAALARLLLVPLC